MVRTYKQRFKIQGPKSILPKFSVLQRTKADVLLVQKPKQWLPKGSRRLAVEHVSSQSQGELSVEETGGQERVHEIFDKGENLTGNVTDV